MSTAIRLSNLYTARADRAGRLRFEDVWDNKRKHRNNLITNASLTMWLHIFGARCEMAAKIFLNPVHWHDFAQNVTGFPDLEGGGVKIDVRGRSKLYYDLPIYKGSPRDWAYLLVTCEVHPVYIIQGWCWGSDGMKRCFWFAPRRDRPAFFVDQSLLRNEWELRNLIHEGREPTHLHLQRRDGVPREWRVGGDRA